MGDAVPLSGGFDRISQIHGVAGMIGRRPAGRKWLMPGARKGG